MEAYTPTREPTRLRGLSTLGLLTGTGLGLAAAALAEGRHPRRKRQRARPGRRRLGWPAVVLLPAVLGALGQAGGRRLQRRRERARRPMPMAEFAGVIAHDFRDPLAALLAQVGALLRRAHDESVSVKTADLQRLQKLGWRLDRLVGDLFDVMVVEGNAVNLQRETVDLAHEVPALLERLAPLLAEHRVSFAVEGSPAAVHADSRRVQQVLTNLLENAAKFSAAGTLIEVGVRPATGGALVTVRDQGVGISPGDFARLFDRSYQAQRTRENKTGLGIGLYLTKALVEAHGGWLSVESEPGRGSLFTVFLPAAREPVEAARPP